MALMLAHFYNRPDHGNSYWLQQTGDKTCPVGVDLWDAQVGVHTRHANQPHRAPARVHARVYTGEMRRRVPPIPSGIVPPANQSRAVEIAMATMRKCIFEDDSFTLFPSTTQPR
eukprot:COSAG02_NODE_2999_length_7580_cov_2.111482_11_plen_114_part_00